MVAAQSAHQSSRDVFATRRSSPSGIGLSTFACARSDRSPISSERACRCELRRTRVPLGPRPVNPRARARTLGLDQIFGSPAQPSKCENGPAAAWAPPMESRATAPSRCRFLTQSGGEGAAAASATAWTHSTIAPLTRAVHRRLGRPLQAPRRSPPRGGTGQPSLCHLRARTRGTHRE